MRFNIAIIPCPLYCPTMVSCYSQPSLIQDEDVTKVCGFGDVPGLSSNLERTIVHLMFLAERKIVYVAAVVATPLNGSLVLNNCYLVIILKRLTCVLFLCPRKNGS